MPITKATASSIAPAAKGDLVVGSATNDAAVLAVGSSGETLVADSSASTGLRWQGNFAAGKNKLINGDFSIWQRGTSFTNPAGASYTADRIRISDTGGSPTSRTISQQTFTPGTAPVAGYEGQYFYRSTLTTVGLSTAVRSQSIVEDVRTLAGQTATFSFWAKSDSTRTQPEPTIEQQFGSGGSSAVNTTLSTYQTTTSWQRFSFTLTIPSISGKTIGTGSHLRVSILQNLTDGSVLDIWGLQLESGSVATAFQTATGTLAGELAACQRYYWRAGGDAAIQYLANGAYLGVNAGFALVNNPVPMRIAPTSVDFSTLQTYDYGAPYNVTNLIILSAGKTAVEVETTQAGSGTTYRPFVLRTNSINAYLGFNAEL